MERTKNVSFAWFLGVWTYVLFNHILVYPHISISFKCRYFRHWLNLVMLWSVWTEFDLIPYDFKFCDHISSLLISCSEHAKQWKPQDGVWFPYWMKYQVFVPLLALQIVNLFWYFLILRIAYRYVFIPPPFFIWRHVNKD